MKVLMNANAIMSFDFNHIHSIRLCGIQIKKLSIFFYMCIIIHQVESSNSIYFYESALL